MARALVVELISEAKKFRDGLNEASTAAEGWGDKVQAGARKMTAFATVPIIGFLGVATKAAADDADAQAHLARELQNSVTGHKNAAGAVEEFIGKAMKASTFSDDELRPAYETIVRSTKDVAESNKLLGLAMDVAASKGIPLSAAALAVTKAQEGQFAAANKLVPGLVDLKDKTITADQVTQKLADTFNGSAAAAAETTSGKLQTMQRNVGELVEGLGVSLLPILTSVVDAVRPVVDWFTNLSSGTQKIIVIVGLAVAAIGPLIGVIGSLSTAVGFLAANPVVLIIAGIAALAAGLVIAYQKCETFRNIVNGAVSFVWDLFKASPIGLVITHFGDLKEAGGKAVIWIRDKVEELIKWIKDIPKAIGGVVSSIPGAGVVKNVFKGITPFAHGGIVTRPTFGLVGEAGPEAIIPLGQFGRGQSRGGNGVTVVVQGNVLDGRQLADMVADGLRRRTSTSGSLNFNL